MTKTIAITAIVLVAVVMGFSTIAPALQQAFAHDVTEQQGPSGTQICPGDFTIGTVTPAGTHPDHNKNGLVCEKAVCPAKPAPATPCEVEQILITIDDNAPDRRR